MKKCPFCGKIYTDNDYYCLKDNHRLENYSKEQSELDSLETQRKLKEDNSQHIPHCPICGSTNIEKISAVKKAASQIMFGIFSSTIGKTFVCKNCGMKF